MSNYKIMGAGKEKQEMRCKLMYTILRNSTDQMEKRLRKKWRKLYPETELLIVTLPKGDKKERERILTYIKQVYTSQEFDEYCQNESAIPELGLFGQAEYNL